MKIKNKLSSVLWLFVPIAPLIELDSIGSNLQLYSESFIKIIDSKQKNALESLYKGWRGDEE